MGYSTSYDGILKFNSELTTKELGFLSQFLDEDLRDHSSDWAKYPGFKEAKEAGYYINLEIAKDFSGLQWNGAEKTSGMIEVVNFIINAMKTIKPDFTLVGKFMCQGEDHNDIWILHVDNNGIAVRIDIENIIPILNGKVECPECGTSFMVEKE